MIPSNMTWNLIQLYSMVVKVFWIKKKSQLKFQPKLELNFYIELLVEVQKEADILKGCSYYLSASPWF